MGWVNVAQAGVALYGASKQRGAAKEAATAQRQAGDAALNEQRLAKEQALGFYAPYADVGGVGLDQSSFLTDSNEQYNWLQGNPLFQMGLDNANQQTTAMGAAKGRLSAGDTLMQLSNNALLAGMPLIQGQKNSISNLMNFGSNMANSQANTAIGVGNNMGNVMMGQGNAQAAGIMGSANANSDMLNGLMSAYSGYMSKPSAPPATSVANTPFTGQVTGDYNWRNP